VLTCDYVFIDSEWTKGDETEIKKGHVFCFKYDNKFKLYVATKSQLVASVLVATLRLFYSEIVYLHYVSCR
jgi:hypothetical protein